MIPESKICGICGFEKTKDCFSVRTKPNGYSWLRRECKYCQNNLRNERYKNIPEVRRRVLDSGKKYAAENRDRVLAYYRKYEIENKDKKTAGYKRKYENNKELIKKQRREYYKADPKRHIAVVNNYLIKNKDKVRAAQRKNHHKRKVVDINYKLTKLLRGRLLAAISNRGIRLSKTKDLLGCSVEFLKQHLESKFTDGMNWGNRGNKGWHIDHIIPCDAFDLTKLEEQRKCFHYTNLQPLFKTTEIAKSFGYLNEIGNRDKSNN